MRCVSVGYISSKSHLLLCLLLVLGQEVVIEQLLDIHPIIGVLLQALIQKIPGLATDEHIRRDGDLILDDLDELLLSGDLEGILSDQHFVHHDAQRPDIDLLVVLLALEDLGADVERGAAEGGPEFVVLVDRPAEVAELDDVLSEGGVHHG